MFLNSVQVHAFPDETAVKNHAYSSHEKAQQGEYHRIYQHLAGWVATRVWKAIRSSFIEGLQHVLHHAAGQECRDNGRWWKRFGLIPARTIAFTYKECTSSYRHEEDVDVHGHVPESPAFEALVRDPVKTIPTAAV